MSRFIDVSRLTKSAFAPFGEVIEADPTSMRLINGGNTERFHALATPEAAGEGARIIINLFRGQPRGWPRKRLMMTRAPSPAASGAASAWKRSVLPPLI